MRSVLVLFLFSLLGVTKLVHCKTKNTYAIGALLYENSCIPNAVLDAALSSFNLEYGPSVRFEHVKEQISTTDTFTNTFKICSTLNRDIGIAAMFGPPSAPSASITQYITQSLNLPNIQYHWKPTNLKVPPNVINLYPDANQLALGLKTLVKHMNWKSFSVVYQNNDGLVRLQEVLKIPDIVITVKQMEPDANADHRLLLKDIKNSTIAQIILDCDNENILNFLTQAKEFELLERYHSYLLTSLDAHTLDFSTLQPAANITSIRIINTDKGKLEKASDILIDSHTQCFPNFDNVENITVEAALLLDGFKLFTDSFEKVIQQGTYLEPESLDCNAPDKKWMQGQTLANYMKQQKFDFLTGPVEFNQYGHRVNFTLHIMEKEKGQKFEESATWHSATPESLHYILNATDTDKKNLENLQATVVRVTSRIGPPYLSERTPTHGEKLYGNDRYEGYSMDLIEEIAKQLNFTYVFQLTADESRPGMIKDLLERKADLAICDLTITRERREIVDFSSPFMTLGISILYQKGKKEKGSMFAFMEPLYFDVWMYTCTFYLVVSIAIYLIARMSPGDWEKPHPCDPDPEELENIWDLKNSFWLTLGSIMTQGCDILPKGISSRTATSMWWFFSLIMTSSYTANMAAFLTKDRMGPTIDSAEALSKQTKIKYGTLEEGSTREFFKSSNFSTYQRMWNQMVSTKPSVFAKENSDGVDRVKNDDYAFLMESSTLEYEIERSCDLKQVGNWLDNKGYGIAMPVNFPHRTKINKAILKLQETGKLDELKTRWWTTKNNRTECPAEDDGSSDTGELALANVGGVFLVLGVGIALAFVLAITEFLWNVHNISVEEHISFWQALKVELKFVVSVSQKKKRVKPTISEKSSSNYSFSGEENKSLEKSILRGATSFFNLGASNRNLSNL